MSITTCDHILGFLIIVVRGLDFDPLNNRNPSEIPTDPISAPVNDIGTAYQITEVVRIYKDDKENSPPTVHLELF